MSFLTCDDIIFSLLDASLLKLEPGISNFEKESQALNNLSLTLSPNEKQDFLRRYHVARELMSLFQIDLENKKIFYDNIKKKVFRSSK